MEPTYNILEDILDPKTGATFRSTGAGADYEDEDYGKAYFCAPSGELALIEADNEPVGVRDISRALDVFLKRNSGVGRGRRSYSDLWRYFADRTPRGAIWYHTRSDIKSVPGMQSQDSYSASLHGLVASFGVAATNISPPRYDHWLALSDIEKHQHIAAYYDDQPEGMQYIRRHTFHSPVVPDWAEKEWKSGGRSEALEHLWGRVSFRFCDSYRGGFETTLLTRLDQSEIPRAVSILRSSIMDGDYEAVSAISRLGISMSEKIGLLEEIMDEVIEGSEANIYVAISLLQLTGSESYEKYLRWHGAHGDLGGAAIEYLVRNRVSRATLDFLLETAQHHPAKDLRDQAARSLITSTAIRALMDDTVYGFFTRFESEDAVVRSKAVSDIERWWAQNPAMFGLS